MTDIAPLPKTREDALVKCPINGHVKYLPDNSAAVLDAFAGSGDIPFWIPDECNYFFL
jgi:hypothetical protein